LTVCLAASALGYERGGGHLWAYLNWALGLRQLDCDVIWLEEARDTTAQKLARQFAVLRRQLEPFGLADRIALHGWAGRLPAGALGADALDSAELLLNMAYEEPELLPVRFPRSALIDIDPGMTQLWLSAGELALFPHDVYFTVGEGVADGTARVDRTGVEWRHTPPCVCLEQWPACPSTDGPYTTVTHWWGYEDEDWVELDGRWIENTKREAWTPFLELPSRTGVPLELALGGLDDASEQRLSARGWTVRDAWKVAGDPLAFRAYVAGSRGEFSAAKPVTVMLRTGWFSDRSACYLASGRPVVLQWTGHSRFLDGGEGVVRFRTVAEAARALRAVEADYELHAARARELAEQHLDARRVVSRVLEQALG
jgi:hypothetical protein